MTVKTLVISLSLFAVFSVQHKRHSLCELDFSFLFNAFVNSSVCCYICKALLTIFVVRMFT